MFFIYAIHNIKNNKIYIGKTYNVKKRWEKHIKIAGQNRNKEKFYIHRAISKYGKHNFVFSIIQSFTNENMANEAEIYWISHFNSNNTKHGYNLTKGGEGTFGRTVSNITKEKMRQKALGRNHTAQTKKKLKDINLGKIQKRESIEKTRQANLGKTLSQEQKNKISESTSGISKNRLTKEQVIEIRAFYRKKYSQRELAIMFGISNSQVSSIVTFRTWKDLNWKNRQRGENKPSSKLTKKEVLEIRKKYKTGKFSYYKLSVLYHVCKTVIADIVNMKKWKHI